MISKAKTGDILSTIRKVTCTAVMLSAGLLVAQDPHAGHDHAKNPHPQQAGSSDSHAGHNHSGQWHNLGTTPGTGIRISAKQLGRIEAGKEGIFGIEVTGAKPPKAVRVWVGVSSAEGSTKSKAEKAGPGYDAHVEVPKTLNPTSLLWVEIEPDSGKKSKASFPLVR